MKTASSWKVKSIVGKVMAGLALATMLGAIDVVPSHSREFERRIERHDDDRFEQRGRGYDRGYDRGRHYRGRRYYQAPVYRERVYVPPPVIYAPPPPPGLSIFLPPLIFR